MSNTEEGRWLEGLDEDYERAYLEEIERRLADARVCPECGHDLVDGPGWSGVVCSSSTCTYWFCY